MRQLVIAAMNRADDAAVAQMTRQAEQHWRQRDWQALNGGAPPRPVLNGPPKRSSKMTGF